eukprot:c13276_g1_i1.p1 GENE.c13276_g1_i1~~c13276_g1_i1.p1  ORF type:complete len:491 (+),score=99.46 c13276_g1_i1:181-1473(+)
MDHFDPNLSFSQEDASLLHSLGLNVIRLGTQWAGVEPQRGVYSQSYLDQIEAIVDLCAHHNISVFLDAHQDSYSERFCGEGAPAWVTKNATTTFPMPLETEPYPINSLGIPSTDDCNKHDWGKYQLTYDGALAYERLYTNVDGLRDSFAGFWSVVAKRFRGKPNVLAIELINEPFCGDFYSEPALLYPGYADRHRLQPFYDAVVAQVLPNDPSRLFMFEPATWSDEFGSPIFDTEFQHAPAFVNHSIYSFHYYPYVNRGTKHAYFTQRRKDSDRLKAAPFVTEMDDIGDLQSYDDFLFSWATWEYKSFLPSSSETPLTPVCTGCGSQIWPDGRFNKDNAKLMSRTYPQAVQGRLTSISFNSTTGEFAMRFTAKSNVSLPTEIYLNEEVYYPNGYLITVTSDVQVLQSTATNVIYLTAVQDGPVGVTIIPK